LRDRLLLAVGSEQHDFIGAFPDHATRFDGVALEQQRHRLVPCRDRAARQEERLEEIFARLLAADARERRARRPALLADPVALMAARVDPDPEQVVARLGVAAFQAFAPPAQRIVALPGSLETVE